MVKRDIYLSRIRPFYDSEMIKVITGIRRCGKSTIMRQMIQELIERSIPESKIIYINFEDYQYRNLFSPQALYEYVEKSINEEGRYYLFFDEIQNVHEFELVINSFRSTQDVRIFITGSNSKILSGELATHLSGRTISFRIMPFNFKEYCESQKEMLTGKSKEELLDEYIKWGGFPLVCKESDETSKHIILSNIYDSVVLKDIIMRNKVASPVALEKVLEYVVANSSKTISGNAIALSLTDNHQSISAPTVYDYLKYIVDACICDKVSRYDIRGKKILAYEEKTYKGEVDFIAQKGEEKIYIQAAYLLSDEHVIEREFGAYESINDNYPKYVITLDRVTLTRDGIIHKNLIDFLLQTSYF